MSVCPNCGKDNVEGAAFCAFCGTPFAEVVQTEERRFLTVMFADLVGFTEESDEADPEDVQARLTPYHGRVRREIERYDGTVEKLIGDGVMAVFGAPIAHEDDPERAVRVALRIQDAVDGLNEEYDGLDLSVRIGINTGEAVVTTGGPGERIVGDVVNTASRLESIAPAGGVVVGEATYRATELLIEYEDMDPVEVKGKARPLNVWRAVEPRGRYGIDAAVRTQTPFLGRESEMGVLSETFRRVIEDGTLRLVTIAAGPGVGKSRLVNEFFAWMDRQPEIVWWRQGRCLPYGEGITFWALGEIVKGHAGIRESDGREAAEEKLATSLEALVDNEADREWLAGQLAPLVGAEGEAHAVDRAEAFAAWRGFLVHLAAVQPLILVIEDLHWADPALVEFLEDLLVWSTDAPIMVICTARPELYEAHPAWGGGQRNSATISLAPLSDQQIAGLLSELLEHAVLPLATQQALLERAGGNPLFAEEFVRMLNDRGMLHDGGHARDVAPESIPVPETVQALIGSRLDLLADDEARIIEDASVVGKVFWEGAIGAIGNADDVSATLRRLVAGEWIRPVRNSSVEGEREYAFWHALIRDVAYGRIPRMARAGKHRTVAEWIEGTAGERASDHAELLAHHYLSALEIAVAAGAEEIDELRRQAARTLVMAGDRAQRLDTSRASSFYERALELMEADDRGRAEVMIKAGVVRGDAGLGSPLDLYEGAAGLALAVGNRAVAGEALRRANQWKWIESGIGAGTEELDRAIDLLEAEPISAELAEAYFNRSGYYMFSGDAHEQLAWSEKGIAIAGELGLDEPQVRGLSMRGIARIHLWDLDGGMADLQESVRLAEATGATGTRLQSAFVNLADHTWMADGPAEAMAIYEVGMERVGARGGDTSWPRAETMWVQWDLGEWDAVLATAEWLLERWAGESMQYVPWAQSYQAMVHVWRGNVDEATSLMAEYLPALREIGDLQLLTPALVAAARTESARGNPAEAVRLLDEFVDVTAGKSPIYRGLWVTDAVRQLVALGEMNKAEALAAESGAPGRRDEISVAAAHAILAEAAGDDELALGLYEQTARDWADFSHALEYALSCYGAGRSAARLARPQSATDYFSRARQALEELGAAPVVSEIDAAQAAVR